MKVEFIRALAYCNDRRALDRKHGRLADAIRRRLAQLAAFDTLDDVRKMPGLACHALTGDRAGQIALSVNKNWRLILELPDAAEVRKPDGGLDFSRIDCVRVIEIVDYH